MRRLFALIIALCLLLAAVGPYRAAAVVATVEFECEALENAVKSELGVEVVTPEAMEGLTHLGAEKAGITSLVGLESAANLATLYLNHNSINDLEPISNLDNLLKLKLAGNPISNFSPLSNLSRLQFLDLSQTGLSDLAFLQGMDSLKHLYLNHNDITDISVLALLPNLYEVRLLGNNIAEIPALDIQILDLSSSGITDLSFLENMGSVKKLYLNNNPALKNADLGVLLTLNKLTHITLHGSIDTDNESQLEVLRTLQDKGVIVKPEIPGDRPDPTGIALDKTSITIHVGQSLVLRASVQPKDANDTLTWQSDNTGVAKVGSDGKVVARAEGQAVITVRTVNGLKATCTVTVVAKETDKPDDPKPPEEEDASGDEEEEEAGQVISLNLAVTRLTLLEGASKQIHVKVRPANAPLTWTSDNPAVVSVDEMGRLTAYAPGQAEITVSAGDLQASCTIIVKPVSQGEKLQIHLDKEKLNIISIPLSQIETDKTLEITHLGLLLHIPTRVWHKSITNMNIEGWEDIDVIIEAIELATTDKLRPVGQGYRFRLMVGEAPITRFAGNLTICFSYDPQAVDNPENLAVFWFDSDQDEWVQLDSTVDKDSCTVSAEVEHWSKFALMETEGKDYSLCWYMVAGLAAVMAVTLAIVWHRKKKQY